MSKAQGRFLNSSGFVLAMTIIVIVIVTFVAMLALTLGSTQKKLSDQVSGKRMLAYYRSQAGLVDAQWRIRKNVVTLNGTQSLATVPGVDFNVATWNPPKYYIDLETNDAHLARAAGDDVEVDIGERDPQDGVRTIDCIGYDTT